MKTMYETGSLAIPGRKDDHGGGDSSPRRQTYASTTQL